MGRELEFSESELGEIFSALWFNMDIDYKQFMLLGESHRSADAGRFARKQGVRYSILSKIVKVFGDSEECKEMRQILDRASEIMVVARGVHSDGHRGTEAKIPRSSGEDQGDA